MQNKNQKTIELSSAELLEMFQVEELDERLKMTIWQMGFADICTNPNSDQEGCKMPAHPNSGVPVNVSCGPPPKPPGNF